METYGFESFVKSISYKTKSSAEISNESFESFVKSISYKTVVEPPHATLRLRALLNQ